MATLGTCGGCHTPVEDSEAYTEHGDAITHTGCGEPVANCDRCDKTVATSTLVTVEGEERICTDCDEIATSTCRHCGQLDHDGSGVCNACFQRYDYVDAPTPRHESSSQAGLFYWAESVDIPGSDVPSFNVVAQVTGYPATEAHDDWFADFETADAIAQMLARGEDV